MRINAIEQIEEVLFPNQLALGITDIDANPDFWDIMQYTKDHGIVPNYTTNGIGVTEEVAQKTHDLCGAVAVSVTENIIPIKKFFRKKK